MFTHILSQLFGLIHYFHVQDQAESGRISLSDLQTFCTRPIIHCRDRKVGRTRAYQQNGEYVE